MSEIGSPVLGQPEQDVVPDRSIISFITSVVMISRCSRCPPIRWANRSAIGTGK